jgi:hypothetical protein
MENGMEAYRSLHRQAAQAALRASNERSARFGLLLSDAEIDMLTERRFEALAQTGRVEFGEGILPALARTFCDSPFLSRENYADTLAQLQDDFYYYKGEAEELLSDDELIEAMKTVFDGRAQGSLAYLEGTSLEALCRQARAGYDPHAAADAEDLF